VRLPVTVAKVRRDLGALTRAYLQQSSAMSYEALRVRQDPPWANIAFGAGGIAYARLRTAGSVRELDEAERWLTAAARSARRRGAFLGSKANVDIGCSVLYGATGLHHLAVLLAHARGDARRFDHAVVRMVAHARRRRRGSAELVCGVAGQLSAARILYRQTGDERLRALADDLAHGLLERAHARGHGWLRLPNLALAHGRAGIFHALLAWSIAVGYELPPWLFGALSELAGDIEARSTMGVLGSAEPSILHGSWCNGAAGLVLLWAKAYECTGDIAHLRQARAAAQFTWTCGDEAGGDLCCGHGGRAYAFLAMDRVAPGAGWFERACEAAARAARALTLSNGMWPNGLSKGYPGLVCLANDLLRRPRARAGFPLVEG
jgi:hypothetical protein